MAISNPSLRDPEYLYAIEGYPHHLYWTGMTADDAQALVLVHLPDLIAIFFDQDGNLLKVQQRKLSTKTLTLVNRVGIRDVFRQYGDEELSSWLRSLGFHESVIKVKRFFLPSHHVGVVDFARSLQQILENPTAYSEDERRVAEAERV